MNEALTLALAWMAGGALGAIFFGGLWWTVRRGAASARPALWFLGSTLLRTGGAMAGFYFISGGRWERMLACLLGFVMTRLLVTWRIRSSGDGQSHPAQEVSHAPRPR